MWYGLCRDPLQRRRELPDINSRNFNIRGLQNAEAITSLIQDRLQIFKIAMIQLDKALVAGGYQTKMLGRQVHDEIVLKCLKSELAAIKKTLVEQTM